MNIRLTNTFTDFTSVNVGGKSFLRVGTPIEFAALIKAGYVVHSNIRPVKGNSPSYSLSLLVPELGRFVAMLRDEAIDMGTTVEDYIEYVNLHADFFATRKAARIL